MKNILLNGIVAMLTMGGSFSVFADDASSVHTYLVRVDDLLTKIHVTACFKGKPNFKLVAESLDASIALVSLKIKSTGKKLNPSGSISLHQLNTDDCVNYVVNVAQPIMKHDKRPMTIKRIGRDLVTAEGIWLWRPERLPIDEKVEITFELPTGVQISAPWLRTGGETVDTFSFNQTPYDWPAFIALGYFTEDTVMVGDSVLRVAILESKRQVNFKSSILNGIEEAAKIVSSVTGNFPASDLQVLVEPGGYGPNAIPMGYVSRGGKPAVHLHINERKHKSFSKDTTLLHEFSHLLLPKVDDQESWLTEGLATYYEYILSGRSGYFSTRSTLNTFAKNFELARLTAPTQSLRDISKSRGFGKGRDKVYWGGAAVFFVADIKLRMMTNDTYTLDTLLAEFADCCAKNQTIWTGEKLFREFDRISGQNIFSELYRDNVVGTLFPDVKNAFDLLGFQVSGFGQDSGIDRNSRLRLTIFK